MSPRETARLEDLGRESVGKSHARHRKHWVAGVREEHVREIKNRSCSHTDLKMTEGRCTGRD